MLVDHSEDLDLVGEASAGIADELYISLHTATTHVSRILTKLHARDRAQLVMLACEMASSRPAHDAASLDSISSIVRRRAPGSWDGEDVRAPDRRTLRRRWVETAEHIVHAAQLEHGSAPRPDVDDGEAASVIAAPSVRSDGAGATHLDTERRQRRDGHGASNRFGTDAALLVEGTSTVFRHVARDKGRLRVPESRAWNVESGTVEMS